ncbi:pyridoxamine 5'-phosphate oxidase family protein [Candidatus Chlorohelix sp.]|uniref:pyridoxamine 5'-phosphate oxidase family protein n=1 Tax=Candidatus Chlorohelix sp. TaxID=3139201 RepID=UPI003053DAD2
MADEQKEIIRPIAGRPNFAPDYGLDTADDIQLLEWEWVTEKMTLSHNYWIGSTRPDGKPHAMPVWGLWLEGTFYFATGRTSRKGRNLLQNPEAVVHLESGDEVVIFEGRVEEFNDPALFERFAEAYGQKYAGFKPAYDPANLYLKLIPRVAFGWLEKDFANSATRWQFS